nr:MAG TPA: hypothetical protein [Caudoviricetes sp.]
MHFLTFVLRCLDAVYRRLTTAKLYSLGSLPMRGSGWISRLRRRFIRQGRFLRLDRRHGVRASHPRLSRACCLPSIQRFACCIVRSRDSGNVFCFQGTKPFFGGLAYFLPFRAIFFCVFFTRTLLGFLIYKRFSVLLTVL